MKVLIIIDSLGTGGAERSTAVLCEYLRSQNIIFELICLDKKKIGVQKELQEKGFKIRFVDKGSFFFQSWRIGKFIKKGRFDVVHSILFRSNMRTRFSKLFCEFIHLESLVNTTYSKERFLDKKVNKNALKVFKILDRISAIKGVDHFHSITETVKNHYIEEIGLNPAKITVIPRGRKSLLLNYDERPANPSKRINLINVGRHEFQKGQIYLLKAAKILKEKGYDFQLIILGRNGGVTKELKHFIELHNLEDYVILEGFKSNVSEYLLKSDLFIFPSLYEGLGGALIEAQAAGLPIVCNDIPVLHEVVKENINAKFFDVHNINSLVNAISYFIEHPEFLVSYGKASFKNFQGKFLEAQNNKKLLDLYKKLI